MIQGLLFHLVVAYNVDDQLGQQGLHLLLVAGVLIFQLKEDLLHDAVNVLLVRAEPEGGLSEQGQKRSALSLLLAYLQIDAVFAHGIIGHRGLGVLHVWSGDVQGVWHNIVQFLIDLHMAVARRNVVDLVAVAAVAVIGNGSQEPFKYNIQSIEIRLFDGKLNV